MTYMIKRRRGSEVFAGFGPAPAYKVRWTSDPAQAMTGDWSWAKGQALALACAGENVQQKPVAA